ncbi:MFS transporter [Neobacillus kokaensis]|uniref:MFS transporter n=1 Tax=Neobacillus kokaensis TaxID=2759023 RepID=A0ABQ3MYZ1_9BACI|nr:MFS transporter [Neobacillus kokaensis]GHH97895.1 MFS transporter [Neobacillus kokaensis]
MENSSSKPIVVIAVVTALCMLGNEMLFIVMPLYWKFFGLTALWQVGVLLSANRMIRIPINSVVGWCYQRVGKRTGVIMAVVLAAVSTFAYGVVKGFWLMLIARCLWGIAWSFFRLGGYLTILSSSNAKTRGRSVGLYNGLWGLGTLFGMLLGGLLAEQMGIQNVTLMFSVIAACSIPFILIFIPNSKQPDLDQKKINKQAFTIWKNKQILSSFATGLSVAFVVYGVFASTLSKLVELQLNHIMILGFTLGAGTITGIIQAVRTGWDPFLAPFLGKYSDQKWGRFPVLMVALVMGAVCLAILPLKLPIPVFLGVLLLFQLTATLLITTSDSIAADLASGPSQVTIIALYTLFSDLGAALGPFLGYLVIDILGINWIYWFTSFLLIPLGVFCYSAFIGEKNRVREQSY